MNEKLLASKLRIAIGDHIADIDLPGFLFEEINEGLLELNYFKVSNLYNNLEDYSLYLEEIRDAYVDFVKRQNPLTDTPCLPKARYESYMTNLLREQNYQCNFSAHELIKIQSLFSVNCILRMKEFINRRILNKKTTKLSPHTKYTKSN